MSVCTVSLAAYHYTDDEPLSNSTDATLKRHSADETDGTPVCKKAKESMSYIEVNVS